jgi:hypothetical protein
MNSPLSVVLNASPEQIARLKALQTSFAEVCNALAPLVQQTRCWQRVTLHHLAYRPLRERFPQLGSQMICNAIYSVSRTSRVVFQHPLSPWNVVRDPARPLPLLKFLPSAPVYFDRHTMSLKAGTLSMYTLDGRIHFQIGLSETDQQRFREEKLREVVLSETVAGFQLTFHLGDDASPDNTTVNPKNLEWPEYVVVENGADTLPVSPWSPMDAGLPHSSPATGTFR